VIQIGYSTTAELVQHMCNVKQNKVQLL